MNKKFSFQESLINLFLTTFSLYSSLLFIDFLIRVAGINNPHKEPDKIEAKRMIEEDIPLRKKAIKNGMKPIIFPFKVREEFLKKDLYPIGSIPNTNNYYCNEGYGLVQFKSDEFGLRNPNQVWTKKNLSRPKIILIGDSFTFGACVDNKYTIAGNLRKSFKNKNIINLAMGGNSPYDYLASLNKIAKEIISSFQNNDYVIMIVFENDNIEKIEGYHEKILGSQTLIELNKSSNRPLKLKNNYIESINKISKKVVPKSDSFLKNYYKNKYKKSFNKNLKNTIFLRNVRETVRKRIASLKLSDENDFINSPIIKSVNELEDICNNKCKPLIVYIPSSTFWRCSSTEKVFKSNLKKYLLNKNISYIDSSKVINNKDRKDYSPKGIHLSKKGYEKVFLLIKEFIENDLKN